MPTFNRADYIGEAIESILPQMTADDDLVIVDDGSADATRDVVLAFGTKVRYLRQENAGKSVALNRALLQTDGEFVWICDDDDLLRPMAVDLLLSKIKKTGADMVFGRYTRFRMQGSETVDMGIGYWPDLSVGSLTRHILEDSFVMHNASLVSRKAYDRAGPFDEQMLRSQDYEMFVRLALHSSIAYADAVIFDQRKHEGARGTSKILHAAGKSEAVWQKFDRMIFDKMYGNVPLKYFECMFDGGSAKLRQRAALLQRGTILARHGLWALALNDFGIASDITELGDIGTIETDILRRSVAGKHGFSDLLLPQNRKRLRAISQGSRVGRQIAYELARGMVWRLRGEDKQARNDALAFFRSAIFQNLDLPRIGFNLLRKRSRSGSLDTQNFTERRQIPTLDHFKGDYPDNLASR